jgi:ribulose-phosphate 3-epimerase
MPEIQIMPSILAADQGHLAADCQRAEAAGADQLHVDIMDARFVANLSLSPLHTRAAREAVKIPLNVHLMMMEPQFYLEAYKKAGADTLLIHAEARCDAREVLKSIRELDMRAGITVNPETPAEAVFEFLDDGLVDEVLCMSVHPGFGGQQYLEYVEPKLMEIRRRSESVDLAIDGGISDQTVEQAAACGVNLFVAGSYLFKAEDMPAALADLRARARNHYGHRL